MPSQTKAGRSPLLGHHSLDPELAALCGAYPTHVVTRNPHKDEIEAFLRSRGVRVQAVHVVPKRALKADVMAAIVPQLRGEPRPARTSPAELPARPPLAVFVDDDVRECRASVEALPGLMACLFRRA